jgi:hypothetical protein
MKNTFTILFVCLSSFLFAQSTLTVFNNGGQQFFVILNGIKQNSIAQTNVSISGISNGSYSVKLIFADGKTKDIDKNFFLEEPSFITTRVVFKKGKGKLQLIGMEPAGNQKPAENMVVYRPSNSAVYSDAPVVNTNTNINQNNGTVQTQMNSTGTQVNSNASSTQTNSTNQQMNMNVGTNVNGNHMGTNTSVQVTETQTTQTTTHSNPNSQGENVNINMSVNVQDPTMTGQGGANISINMSGTGTGSQTQQGTYQQTTTTTVTSSGNQNSSNTAASQQVNSNQSNSQVIATNNANVSNGSTAVACKNILGNEKEIIDDLNTMTFDEDKKEIVMKDLANHCLTASQAYKIIEVFTFEADRLELAKYFYNRMIDKDSAKNLLPLFTFDATKVEFREYIRR